MQQANSKKAEIIFQALAQIIKEEREKKNKSLRILAYEYDIQKSLLSRLENGKNDPRLSSVWSVCDALELDISELFARIKTKLPENFSLIEK